MAPLVGARFFQAGEAIPILDIHGTRHGADQISSEIAAEDQSHGIVIRQCAVICHVETEAAAAVIVVDDVRTSVRRADNARTSADGIVDNDSNPDVIRSDNIVHNNLVVLDNGVICTEHADSGHAKPNRRAVDPCDVIKGDGVIERTIRLIGKTCLDNDADSTAVRKRPLIDNFIVGNGPSIAPCVRNTLDSAQNRAVSDRDVVGPPGENGEREIGSRCCIT